VPIENSVLNENMEFALPPASLLSGAHHTSFVGGRHDDDLQISTALQVENLALRHQLTVLHRSVKRPKLTSADRLLWA